MGDAAERKARGRDRLQNRLREKQMAQLEGGNLHARRQSLCEDDVKTLLRHINFVSTLGIPEGRSHLWSDIVRWLEEAVVSCEESTEKYGPNTQHRRLKMNSSVSAQANHTAEARKIVNRLHHMVDAMPEGSVLDNPWRLGFESVAKSVRTEIARAGRDDDPTGNKSLLATCRQFEELGIPGPYNDPSQRVFLPRTANEWKGVLDVMEKALAGYRSRKEVEEASLKPSQRKPTQATITRIQDWIDYARRTYTAQQITNRARWEGGNL